MACKAVNVCKETLERQFVAQLNHQSRASCGSSLRAATQRLAKLTERKNLLVDANLYRRINQQTYDEQIERLRA
jgi:hypothetical protein